MGAELIRLENAARELVPDGSVMKTLVGHCGSLWRVAIDYMPSNRREFLQAVDGFGRTLEDALFEAQSNFRKKLQEQRSREEVLA